MNPNEVKSLTLKNYERISIGRELAKEEKWQFVRAIETAILNWGGMGAKEYTSAEKVRPLPFTDAQTVILPIKTIEQAYKLLDTWLD